MTKITKTLIALAVLGAGLGYVGKGIYTETSTAEGSDGAGVPIKNSSTFSPPALASSDRPLSIKEIKLSKDNHVVFREDFNALSVANAQQKLLEKSNNLGSGEPLYLVLDTPGGSIDAGNALIDTAKSLGRPVHTITVFAASMGFNTAQRLDKRYILPSGVLMAHRARVSGVSGQVPGEFLTAAANLVSLVNKMEGYNAKRLRISSTEYTELVRDEYWVDGEDAVRQGAADELVSLKCDDSLRGTSTQTVQSFMGSFDIIWANCPAITLPLGAVFGVDERRNQLIRALVADYGAFRKQAVQERGQGSLQK